MMKRVIALLGVIVLFTTCEKKEQEVPVSSVSITQAKAEMIIGETIQLSATVSPSNATEKTISWASSKVSVATVANGKVTAVAEGTSTITASCGGKSATCQVTVSKGIVAVTSITLNKESVSLVKGESETLVATVKPDDATDKTVTWSSSEATVASVDNNGKVTAIAGGSAVITARAGDKQATCTVTVTVPVESITLDRESVTLEEDGTTSLVATVKPDDATDKAVIWSSSDSQIAKVDETGEVKAIKEGEATITAAAGEKTASCKVTVNKKKIAVESVSLDKTELSLFEGESAKLAATVKPDNASDKTVTWSNGSPEIASVDQEGNVKAIKAGSATITAKAGDKTVDCLVTVEAYDPNSIKFADPKVKEKLVAAFDTNHDGILSYEEAAAVTSSEDIKAALKNIKTYKSFDELQFFTGITSIPDAFFEDWNLLTSVTLPKSVTSIGKSSFKGCIGLESITLPEEVKKIGADAFYGCTALITINIPEYITSIEADVFWGCTSLSSISIPEKVTCIGNYAFSNCTNLTSISIPENVTRIGKYAFSNCVSISSPIVLPNKVQSIEEWTFDNCGMPSITIPYGVTFIGEYALAFCRNLTSLTIPESVNSIGDGAFRRLNISSIVIPDSVTSIGSGAFYECKNLVSITIPESISSIHSFTFFECKSLISITIPESVTSIGYGAFYHCESLPSIIIPKSVNNIGDRAFANCPKLESITILASTPPSLGGDIDGTLGGKAIIYVPSASVELYKQKWNSCADRICAIQ